ncbi:hypothetical protein HY988_02780 [Candidatus Micrarchaeota archaeon]|nr:hypothetical protein [Candidatus Micrarchaeota archaeon]
MLLVKPQVSRVELIHPTFADAHKVAALKREVLQFKENYGFSRAVLRVPTGLADGQHSQNDGFILEAVLRSGYGTIEIFGFNDPNRKFGQRTIEEELGIVRRTVSAPRRSLYKELPLIRLEQTDDTAQQLSALYSTIYRSYPIPLNPKTIFDLLGSSIAYGIVERGSLAAVLFGEIIQFENLHLIELTHAAAVPRLRGDGIITILAEKIRSEAQRRFGKIIIFAEAIPGPVMRSCHDFGMTHCGILREHSNIAIGDSIFSNLYVWSL